MSSISNYWGAGNCGGRSISVCEYEETAHRVGKTLQEGIYNWTKHMLPGAQSPKSCFRAKVSTQIHTLSLSVELCRPTVQNYTKLSRCPLPNFLIFRKNLFGQIEFFLGSLLHLAHLTVFFEQNRNGYPKWL